ncbi:MAG TPA: hypothetical protein VHL80_01460, partial [Polyangia bacterium]|nr:hypothetical protein [Polyangia bacterium]
SGAGIGGAAGAAGAADAGGPSGSADADGGAGAVMTTSGELAKGPYTCTTYVGSVLTTEWWNLGFETIVDNAKWQLKWHHHGYIQAWGDPATPFWSDTGDPNNLMTGSPIVSPCAQNSTTPDRVVFLAIDWELLTEQDWVGWLEKDLVAIKTKWPSVRWIDIMPTPRCPDDMMCNPNAKPGPGANDGAGPEDCYIAPYIDSAIAKVVAATPTSWVSAPSSRRRCATEATAPTSRPPTTSSSRRRWATTTRRSRSGARGPRPGGTRELPSAVRAVEVRPLEERAFEIPAAEGRALQPRAPQTAPRRETPGSSASRPRTPFGVAPLRSRPCLARMFSVWSARIVNASWRLPPSSGCGCGGLRSTR